MSTPAIGSSSTAEAPIRHNPTNGSWQIKVGDTWYPYRTPTTQIGSDGSMVSNPATGMEDVQKVSRRKASGFDGETFLKLLVAQLRYQDPNKPADSTQIMQQSATLAMVERINEMAESNDTVVKNYASMLAEQRMSSAVALVGKHVKYTIVNPDTNDTSKPTISGEGQVESVKFTATGPILKVEGTEIPLANIDSVIAGTTAIPPTGDTNGTAPKDGGDESADETDPPSPPPAG